MEHFTREEAALLLGETVVCKKAVIKEYPDLDQSLVLFDEGEKSDVVLVEKNSEVDGVFVSLLVDGDYLPFHKQEFNRHCSVLKSVSP